MGSSSSSQKLGIECVGWNQKQIVPHKRILLSAQKIYAIQGIKPKLPTSGSTITICKHDAMQKMITMLSEAPAPTSTSPKTNYMIFFDAVNLQASPNPLQIVTQPDYTGEMISYEMLQDNILEVHYWTYVCNTELRQSPTFNQYTCVQTLSDGSKYNHRRLPALASRLHTIRFVDHCS